MTLITMALKEVLRKYYWPWAAKSPSTRDCRLFVFQARKLGLLNYLFKGTYNRTFFEQYESLAPGYRELAAIIHEVFRPRSVVDIGCGSGFLIQCLNAFDVQVLGVDGASEMMNFIDPSIRANVLVKDLSSSHDLGKFDLAISTEVAEHIPKKHSRSFVKNLTRNAQKKIILSAAQPGQWGDGHVNCQPKKFWINIIESEGWIYSPHETVDFTKRISSKKSVADLLPWALNNFMIFTPQTTGFNSDEYQSKETMLSRDEH